MAKEAEETEDERDVGVDERECDRDKRARSASSMTALARGTSRDSRSWLTLVSFSTDSSIEERYVDLDCNVLNELRIIEICDRARFVRGFKEGSKSSSRFGIGLESLLRLKL